LNYTPSRGGEESFWDNSKKDSQLRSGKKIHLVVGVGAEGNERINSENF
jgi:hypothetical protein